MNQEITQIKKALFQAISKSWNETNIYWQESQEEHTENTWSNIHVLSLQKVPSRGKYRRYLGVFSFSIFSTDLSNIYALDQLADKFLRMFQNTCISQSPVALKIQEAEIVSLEDSQRKISKVITYRVITLDFFGDITE